MKASDVVLQSQSEPTIGEIIKNHGLTNREVEVFHLLLNANSTSDIAQKMHITEKTVQNYISSLLAKTQSKSRGEMIAKFKKVIF